MVEEKKGLKIGFILSMTGAMIAYYIGASTGSGQEFYQAYSTQGVMGIAGIILQQVIMATLALVVILTCKKHQLNGAKETFIFFLGKYIGTAVYYYTVAFVFCTLIQLISGTGNIVSQFYGVPYYIGAVGLAVLSVISVLCGFEKLIAIISKIAPLLIIIMGIVAIVSLINPTDGLAAGSELVLNAEGVYRTSSNWFSATMLHHTYLVLFLVPYFVSCHTLYPKAARRDTIIWIILSFAILTVICVLMVASHVANMSVVMGAAAPNVMLASVHMPKIGALFVIMIVAACYTTTSPIALIAAEYFAKPGTVKFKVWGSAIVLVALAISFAGSYAQIINILVSVSGRIGVAIYAIAFIYGIYKLVVGKKDKTAVASADESEA